MMVNLSMADRYYSKYDVADGSNGNLIFTIFILNNYKFKL